MAGVFVEINPLRERILTTNDKFNRPFIIINVAASIDGKIALRDGKRMNISTEDDLRRVHLIRNEVDGILVGINTILSDNPGLGVKRKYISGHLRNPVRIVLDSTGKISPTSKVLLGNTPTIIAVAEGNRGKFNWIFENGLENVSIEEIKTEVDDRLELVSLFNILFSKNIRSILVEGGSTVISYLLRKGYFDMFTIYFRNFIIGGTQAPSIVGDPGATMPGEVIPLSTPMIEQLEGGHLFSYFPQHEWISPVTR